MGNAVKEVVRSFCVAGLALCDILMCLRKLRKSYGVTGAMISGGFHKKLQIFWWKAQHLGIVHVLVAWQAQHFGRVVLCVFLRVPWAAASRCDSLQISWQA